MAGRSLKERIKITERKFEDAKLSKKLANERFKSKLVRRKFIHKHYQLNRSLLSKDFE
jgi:hypothetical protein